MHVADFMESGERGDCLFTSSFHFRGLFCVWVWVCNLFCERMPSATLMITIYHRGSPILCPVMVSYLFSFPCAPAGEWKSIKLSSDWWDGFWMTWSYFSEICVSVGPLMDWNLVVRSLTMRKKRKEANIPWVTQPDFVFQRISQK